MSKEATQQDAHWKRTRRLMIITLSIWFLFAYLIPWFANVLNGVSFLGFPLGYYMAAQGSLIIFVVLIFWFARTQHKIDVEYGMAEDE